MIGRRPEPIPGHTPGRWLVKKVKTVRGTKAPEYPWCVLRENCAEAAYFPTWSEAHSYADREARTHEFVLPRQVIRPTDRHLVHRNGVIMEWKQSNGQPTISPGNIVVEPHERVPLALALLTLAAQEEA